MEESKWLLIILFAIYLFATTQFLYFYYPVTVFQPIDSPTVDPISHEDVTYSARPLGVSHVSWPVVAQSNVEVLTGDNFSYSVNDNHYVMVNFYAPWCNWSLAMAPEFAAAATALKGEVMFGEVDATVESYLAREYGIRDYPTLYFFIDGVQKAYPCDLQRKRDAIVKWINKMKIDGVYPLTSVEDAKRVSTAESTIVLGILETLEGPDVEELSSASIRHTTIKFYKTSSVQVTNFFHIDPQNKRPALFLVDNKSKSNIRYGGPFNRFQMSDFVLENKIPSVTRLTRENASLFKVIMLYSRPNDSEAVESWFWDASRLFKGKLQFASVLKDYVQLGNRSNVTADSPKVVAYSKEYRAKYVLNAELTLSSIKDFAQSIIDKQAPESIESSVISTS